MEAAELPDAHREQALAGRSLRAAACVVGLVGVVLRIATVGRPGFWNDEAWVALSTRVSGVAQFLLSLSVTPVLWAALLRPLALLPLPPEISLRLLPFAFGVATLWLAWRLGWRLVDHPRACPAAPPRAPVTRPGAGVRVRTIGADGRRR